MQDETFTLKVAMSEKDVSNLFTMLERTQKYDVNSGVPSTQWASYWKGFFEQALELSTSQPIYRKPPSDSRAYG